ncbi:ferredoxin-NADP reductase [Rhodococcus sp. OK519]|uniref:ferredoxin reductase n=1 Tax=Rhodococcus sp. OK519 TaxID=2135729 RepID=UPI000D4DBBAD|nr:ferredoxin-NADP reductase [Rhodococcus sp. OK519]
MTTSSPTRPRRRRLLSLFEALATPHAVDRYLELLDPMATAREMRARVVRVARPTPDSVVLGLRPTRHWRGYVAGQFVQVGVVIDGVRHTRCYSPTGSERSDAIELIVRAHPGGLVSQYLVRHANEGMVVDLSTAAGEFALPQPRPREIVLVSGGSGITPVLAMLRTLVDEGFVGRIAFLHYARTLDDVPVLGELRSLGQAHGGLDVRIVETSAEGRFDREHLDDVAPWFGPESEVFVCGPDTLSAALREHLDLRGFGERMHTEQFRIASPEPVGPTGGAVSFTRSGVTTENTGTSLLEQAEAAGLQPEYGCRMGICFSCTAVKRSGRTRNVRTGETHDDPDQSIQLCISAPVGDVEIDV